MCRALAGSEASTTARPGLTRRCRPPGAITTRPGASRSPSTASLTRTPAQRIQPVGERAGESRAACAAPPPPAAGTDAGSCSRMRCTAAGPPVRGADHAQVAVQQRFGRDGRRRGRPCAAVAPLAIAEPSAGCSARSRSPTSRRRYSRSITLKAVLSMKSTAPAASAVDRGRGAFLGVRREHQDPERGLPAQQAPAAPGVRPSPASPRPA